jgi:hypothetical protein
LLDEPVGVFSRDAVKWDLLGAVAQYTGLPIRQSELRLLSSDAYRVWSEDNAASDYKCLRTLHDFNDTTSWKWVKQALEQANL